MHGEGPLCLDSQGRTGQSGHSMKTNCPDCGTTFMLPAFPAPEPYKEAQRRAPPDPNKKLTNAASTFSCLSFLCVFVPYVGLLIAAPLWIAGFVLCIMLLVKGEYSRGAGTMIFLFLFVPFAWALRLGYALGL